MTDKTREDHIPDAGKKVREDFEAAIRTNLGDDDGWFILGALGDYASEEVQNKWEGYRAATQQSAARIAALEAEVLALRKDAVRRVFTYKNQPTDNVIAWRFGQAARSAQPGGDLIDYGLSLLQKLQEQGYGVVAIEAERGEG